MQITKDVFALLEPQPDGNTTIKYYDENQELIAFRGTDGELIPSQKYLSEDLSFLSEIDNLQEKEAISLKEVDEQLEKVAKYLGKSKSEIISMSEVDLDDEIDSKEDNSLTLSNDRTNNEKNSKEQNDKALKNISGKQEIDLDNKVDNKHTLAEILDVPANSKLVIVASSKINGNTITSHDTCIIKTPDGELEECTMLEQVGGKNSDKNVHEVDRDGNVQKQNVRSSFKINSPIVNNAVITIRQGQMGTTKVAYGLTDPTSHRDVFAQDLETSETYPVSAKVRNEFSEKHGVYNVTEKMDEIEEHEKHGERKLSLEESDGRPETGHIHGKEAAEIILSDDEFVNKTNDIFSSNEIAERFDNIREKYPNLDRDKLIEITKQDLEYDAEHMPSHEHQF